MACGFESLLGHFFDHYERRLSVILRWYACISTLAARFIHYSATLAPIQFVRLRHRDEISDAEKVCAVRSTGLAMHRRRACQRDATAFAASRAQCNP